MSISLVPSLIDSTVIRLETNGKSLESLEIYQADEVLNVDLHFQDKTVLEVILRIGFQASATLLESRNGDLVVLERVNPVEVTTDS